MVLFISHFKRWVDYNDTTGLTTALTYGALLPPEFTRFIKPDNPESVLWKKPLIVETDTYPTIGGHGCLSVFKINGRVWGNYGETILRL